jgi:hypothetical protein
MVFVNIFIYHGKKQQKNLNHGFTQRKNQEGFSKEWTDINLTSYRKSNEIVYRK